MGGGKYAASNQSDSLIAFHVEDQRLYYAEARDMWVRIGDVEANTMEENSTDLQTPSESRKRIPPAKVFMLPSLPHPHEGTTTYAERCTALSWFPYHRHEFPLLLVGFNNGAFLAMSPGGQLVFLYAGLNTLGRGVACTQSAPIQQFITPLDGPGTSEFGLIVKQPSAAVFITSMDFYEALHRNYRVPGFRPFYLDELDVSGTACGGESEVGTGKRVLDIDGGQPDNGTPGERSVSESGLGQAGLSQVGLNQVGLDEAGLNLSGPLPPALLRELSRPATGGTEQEIQEVHEIQGGLESGAGLDSARQPAAPRAKKKRNQPLSSLRAIKVNVIESERIVAPGKGAPAMNEGAFPMYGVENVRHGYLSVSTSMEASYYCPLISCYMVSYAPLTLSAERPQAFPRRAASLSPACPASRLSTEGPADFLGSRQSALFIGPRPGVVKISTITSDVCRLELSADTINLINFMRANMFPKSSGAPTMVLSPTKARHLSSTPPAPVGVFPANRYFDLSIVPIPIESVNSVVFIARYTYSLIADFFDMSFGFLEGDFSLAGDAEANPGCVHEFYSPKPLKHALNSLPRSCDLRTAIRTSEYHTSSVNVDLLGLLKETYGELWKEVTGLFEAGYEVPYVAWADLADVPDSTSESPSQASQVSPVTSSPQETPGPANNTNSIPFLAALTNRDELVIINLDTMEATGVSMVVRRYGNDICKRLTDFAKTRAGEASVAGGKPHSFRPVAKVSMCTQMEGWRRVLYVCLTYCGHGVEAVDERGGESSESAAETSSGTVDGSVPSLSTPVSWSPPSSRSSRTKSNNRSLIVAISPHTLQVLDRWEEPATMLLQIGARGYAGRPDGLWPIRCTEKRVPGAEGEELARNNSHYTSVETTE